jgi:hypothetical protein
MICLCPIFERVHNQHLQPATSRASDAMGFLGCAFFSWICSFLCISVLAYVCVSYTIQTKHISTLCGRDAEFHVTLLKHVVYVVTTMLEILTRLPMKYPGVVSLRQARIQNAIHFPSHGKFIFNI